MQERIETSLVTEDVIINFSSLFKRLEDGAHFGPELLKNKMLKCFWWAFLYCNETVSSSNYSFQGQI